VDEPTPAELQRSIERLEKTVAELTASLSDQFMPREVMEIRFKALLSDTEARDDRLMTEIADVKTTIGLMQNWQQWIVRLVIGAIITVVVTYMLSTFLGSK
jgi:hypothetical protein